MKKMRLVGLNPGRNIFVQTFNGVKWDQVIMEEKEFTEFMCSNFPTDYEEYKKSGSSKNIMDYFYSYNETEEMLRKGEAYVFTK